MGRRKFLSHTGAQGGCFHKWESPDGWVKLPAKSPAGNDIE